MRKFAALIALFVVTLALAGCGGDSGCGALSGGGSSTSGSGASTCTGTSTGTGNTTPSKVTVSSGSATIPTDGSASATISSTVVNSSGAAVAGVTVTFGATGGTLSSTTGTTNANGVATTTLTAAGVATGTAITVTATAGSVSGTVAVTVSSTGGSSNVASLTVTTTVATVPADGSGSTTITVLAKDASNNALSGVSVGLSASAGTLMGATTTTAANGTITASLSAAGVTAGTTITITATSGTVTGKATVSVVATQQTILLLTSSPQMPSNNSKPATITAIVQGANNQLVSGVALTFSASTGAIAPVQTTAGAAATVPAGTTDANGVAQATLSTPGNETNRTITVTVTAGATIQTLQVAVVGTTLSVSGPASIVLNANGAYSVSLTDSAGNGIANQTVALASALGNTLTPTSVTTGITGTASFTLAAANSGAETITGTWQNSSATESVAISSQNFSITAPTGSTNVPVSPTSAGAVPVTVAWTASGAGQNGTVVLSTTRGTLSATSVAATNGALATPVTLYSSTAGPAIISATALNSSNQAVATAQTSVLFVATTPSTVAVQATPSTVAVQGQSTITATVTDASGNPVFGATVDFTLTDTTGGSLSSPSAQTTAQGQATVTYTASTTSSTPNGVSIAVKVEGTNVSSATTLTVGGQTVFLSLGTGNTIVPYPVGQATTTQYELPYTVQAVDAAGNGVSNVSVTFSVQSVSYETGDWTCAGGTCVAWTQNIAAPASNDPKLVPGIGGCRPTQVYELNGQIQTGTPPNPIPSNWVLTSIPGNVAATDVGSATTGTGGTAAVNIIYPKDHSAWVSVALTATATVQGTQNSTTATFFLPILAADIDNPKIEPPGVISPYGISQTCY